MPVSPTYPGVYIQEVDSGSRVVSGVATSITAFVGRTSQGPANTPLTVFDYGEFQKLFGGRTRDLPMTYAVEDFFGNGGSQAVIVRVCAGAPLGSPSSVDLKTDDPKYTLTTKLKGLISTLVFVNVTKDATSGHYTITFTLGSATSKVVLATLPDLAPEGVDMALKGLSDVVGVSYGGGSLEAADATKMLDALVGKPAQFAGGVTGAGAKTPMFIAGDLEIDAKIAGPWADDLDISLVPKGAGAFSLVVDHPDFMVPYELPLASWDDIKKVDAETGLLTVKTTPDATAHPLATFVKKGVPLTRVPDGSGASAAMRVYGPLVLTASSPGLWGNGIGVSFDKRNIGPEVALRFVDYGIPDASDFWNVNIYVPLKAGQTPSGAAETIGPVYLGPIDAPCRIDHMLAAQSNFLRARAPIAAAGGKDLPLDPSQINKTDPKDTVHRIGVLFGGQDGDTLSSDIVVGSESKRTGIYALELTDLFNIMVIPPDPLLGGDDDMTTIYGAAAQYCEKRRAVLIADPLDKWGVAAKKSQFDRIVPDDYNIGAITTRRSVFTYFPRVKKLDPEYGNREKVFSASGIIAGIFAATDVRRGVWKAPAGIEAGMNGVTNLEHKLTDMQNGILNQVGVNVLRDFPIIGKVVWGSRTLAGADALSDDYKYLPVRRLTNYIEESLFRASKFAVFEPNAEPLWSQLRLMIGTFMADLSRQGAFYDYFVRCDKSTTTQFDIDRGRVNVIVAFAPVKPAEFVILTIQQLAGQTAA